MVIAAAVLALLDGVELAVAPVVRRQRLLGHSMSPLLARC
jgi:hypothetical protein